MLVLVLLGIVYNFGWDWSWERLRLPSVLGLIGVSSFLAATILVLFRKGIARLSGNDRDRLLDLAEPGA